MREKLRLIQAGWSSRLMGWSPTHIGLVGISGTVAALVMVAPSWAATLENWQFNPDTQQLIITVPKGVTPQYYLVAEPARIVVDLPNLNVGTVSSQQTYSGAVRSIRVAQFQPDLARIVLELAPGALLAQGQVEMQRLDSGDSLTDRWVVRPLLANASVTSSPVTTPAVTPEALPDSTASNSAPSDSLNQVNQPVAPPDQRADLPANPPSSPSPTVEETAQAHRLPPLEPGAVEIPMELPSENEPTPNLPPLEPNAVEIPIEQPIERSVAVAPQSILSQVTSQAVPQPSSAPPVVQPVAQPVAQPSAVSPPLPVDFSRPPAPFPDPNFPAGTADNLTSPSAGSAAISTATRPQVSLPQMENAPLSNPMPSPTPTAGGVSVPSITTVAQPSPPAVDQTSRTSRSSRSRNSARRSDRSTAQTANPEPVASSSPTTQAVPASIPTASIPTASIPAAPAPSPQPVSLSFGQPIPLNQIVPASPTPTWTSNSALDATTPSASSASTVPSSLSFGQPIPVAQPSPAVRQPRIEVIPFGQPLPR